jgi:hypothetical protein
MHRCDHRDAAADDFAADLSLLLVPNFIDDDEVRAGGGRRERVR